MNKQVLIRALNKWGYDAQLGILQEECGELISAISKYKRKRPLSFIHMLEEIADVEIMITQIKLAYLYGADKFEYTLIKRAKLRRLKKRVGL